MNMLRKLAVVIVALMYSISAQADPIIHYFEGTFGAAGNFLGPCPTAVCEDLKAFGSDFFGFLSYDSMAVNVRPDDPGSAFDVGVYQSDGFPFGVAMYLAIADAWLFTSSNVMLFFQSRLPQYPEDFQDRIVMSAEGVFNSPPDIPVTQLTFDLCYPPGTLTNTSPQAIPRIGDPCNVADGFGASVLAKIGGADGFVLGSLTKIRRVPEPGTIALLSLGLLGLGLSRRKKV